MPWSVDDTNDVSAKLTELTAYESTVVDILNKIRDNKISLQMLIEAEPKDIDGSVLADARRTMLKGSLIIVADEILPDE